MPENPPPVPPDDPCYEMVVTHNEYVVSRIDAFLHADWQRNFADTFAPLQQCCGELRPKVDRLRPADPDREALGTFTIPLEVFDAGSECGKHPYFQEPAGGGLSPANRLFQEVKQSRSDFWLHQYTDLSEELHACCVRHLSQCLLRGTEARSCIEPLLPEARPSAALPAAATPEAAAPAVSPPATPAGETQAPGVFQQAYDHLTESVSLEFPFGLTYLVVIAIGAGLGWLGAHLAYRVFGKRVFFGVRPDIRRDRRCRLVPVGQTVASVAAAEVAGAGSVASGEDAGWYARGKGHRSGRGGKSAHLAAAGRGLIAEPPEGGIRLAFSGEDAG